MEFYKYHGAGNDFILLKDLGAYTPEILAKNLCHRRFGIGADGLMYPSPSDVADIKMNYYNSDGSFATMCGNGLRCFAKFVYEEGFVDKESFSVETGDGIKTVSLGFEDQEVVSVRVEMHRGELTLANHAFELDQESYKGAYLHLGVPHLVLPVDTLTEDTVTGHGSKLEKAPVFKDGTNVNFLRVEDKATVLVDTWERGAGYTYACGTGCCASVYVAYKLGLTGPDVTVKVKGGILRIEVLEGDVVMMTGPARKICKGHYLEGING